MSLFDRVVVPVASEEDARATAASLVGHLDPGSEVTVVHVVPDVEGGPDPTPTTAQVEDAEAYFAAFEEILAGAAGEVETAVRHEPGVVDAILDVADEVDATAIAFTPRGGSRWVKLLAGDVTTPLLQRSTVPVIVLPDPDEERYDA